MIAVVQRVREASVEVEGHGLSGSIGRGFCVLLGVVEGDGPEEAAWMAGKLARLRVFADSDGRFNLALPDVAGSVLLISQFTLAGDCTRGNRPGFTDAAAPEVARPLYELVGRTLVEEHGLPVETGMFQTAMEVRIINEGPATFILDSAHRC